MWAQRPAETSATVPNDPDGIGRLVDELRALRPTLIVLEATGGYETALEVSESMVRVVDGLEP